MCMRVNAGICRCTGSYIPKFVCVSESELQNTLLNVSIYVLISVYVCICVLVSSAVRAILTRDSLA